MFLGYAWICVGYVLVLDRALTSCQYSVLNKPLDKQDGRWRMADGRKMGKLQVEYLTVVSYEPPR